ncbi:MAG TPA: hypothetical protein VFX59_29295 [Polyangiales bacterium]|nr:hypothetical protein [Polyangiales bacterium]
MHPEDVVEQLKIRARFLQKQIERLEPPAVKRARTLPELRSLQEDALRENVQRRHCLAILARELGLNGWSHLTELWTSSEASEWGKLFYPAACGGHWNMWSSSLEEARAIRAEHGGFLLPYRHQMLIVERAFIEDLGLDSEHPDWARIGRNWLEPGDLAARHRLLKAMLCARITS